MRLIIFILSIIALTCLKAEDFWQPLTAPASGVHNISIAPNGNVFIGSDDGLFFSKDKGISWINGNIADGKCRYPYVTSDYTVYSLTSGNNIGMAYSKDQCSTWTMMNSPKGMILFSSDSLTLLSQRGNCDVYRTNNYGSSWQEVFHMPSGGSEFVRSVIPQNDSAFFMGITDFQCSPGNTCGGVYRSNDSGTTWQRFGLKYHFVWAMAKDSTGNIYAGVNGHYYNFNGGVFINNGQDTVWQQLKNNILVTSLAVTPDNVLYAGHHDPTKSFGGVIRSFDGGLNWEDITSGMSENRSVEMLTASSDGFIYALAEFNGQQQLYRSRYSTGIEPITGIKQLELSAYPNPFNNECRISFQLPSEFKDKSFITFYNIKGEAVQRAKVSGNHYTFQAASLAAGVYYAVVNTGNLSKGIRLLYLK